MHKCESYGSWEDCSDYWNNVNDNDLIKITTEESAKEKEDSFPKYYERNKIYFLNKRFRSKKLIINNINNIIENYGKCDFRR